MRGASPSSVSFTLGPGPLTPAIKALIIANAVGFVAGWLLPSLAVYGGLIPGAVVERFWLWQPVSYMFLHGGLFHLLFNMLALWMFGVELERVWGTSFFTRFYFVAGIGAALFTILVAVLGRWFWSADFAVDLYLAPTVGASGAIYGLLLAYAMYFPSRPIYLYMLFPIPARIFVLIVGAISLLSSIQEPRGGVAHITHLGGLVAGYLYLKGGRGGIIGQWRFRFNEWRRTSRRHRFEVHEGGRSKGGPNRWVH
jgi:membrane associated rhomboid family serine protease